MVNLGKTTIFKMIQGEVDIDSSTHDIAADLRAASLGKCDSKIVLGLAQISGFRGEVESCSPT